MHIKHLLDWHLMVIWLKCAFLIPEYFTSVFFERKISMESVNPKFILRNYLAEIAIRKAEDNQDYSEIEKLLNILHHRFDEWIEFENYASLPPNWARQISVSCSPESGYQLTNLFFANQGEQQWKRISLNIRNL
jgi:hypothetical protein